MIVGVPKETFPAETRVALVPAVVASLVSAGFEILIETGAGDRAGFADDANDAVNPSARTDPSSPIAGMPLVDVDRARTVVVIKRNLSPGFAGIANPLFAADNTLVLFGDGKKMVQALIAALKEY